MIDAYCVSADPLLRSWLSLSDINNRDWGVSHLTYGVLFKTYCLLRF